MSKKLINFWPLALLLILTLLLRIFKIEELFYFTYDEAIPAFVGRRLILWQHIPLIGGVTPFGFHLAPYFYWFYAVLLFFGKLNPIIWGYAGAVIALITTFLMYKIGESLGSKKLAVTAAIFWTFSFLANLYDRHLWALYWGPLISLLILMSLYKIITSSASPTSSSVIPAPCLPAGRKGAGIHSKAIDKFTYLLGTTIALGIHADPSNLAFLVLAFVVWAIYKLPIKKSTFVALGLILFSFLPLVIFDLRHDFANTRPVIEFWSQGRNNPNLDIQKLVDNSLLFPRAFTRLIYTFGDNQIVKQYSYCRNYVLEKFNAIPWYFVMATIVIVLTFMILNIRKNKHSFSSNRNQPVTNLITILLILYFVGIQTYGTIFRADVFEHYITGLFAVFLLILAKVVSYLPRNLWLVALAVFITLNLHKLLTTQNSQGLTYKREAIAYTMQQVGDRPFSLDSLSTCWKLNGYRYLFAVFGREPVKSYVDPNFAYLYGTTPVAEKHPQTVVAFVVHDFAPETEEFYKRYTLLKSHEVKSTLFGIIEVIIMDNSTGWFEKS